MSRKLWLALGVLLVASHGSDGLPGPTGANCGKDRDPGRRKAGRSCQDCRSREAGRGDQDCEVEVAPEAPAGRRFSEPPPPTRAILRLLTRLWQRTPSRSSGAGDLRRRHGPGSGDQRDFARHGSEVGHLRGRQGLYFPSAHRRAVGQMGWRAGRQGADLPRCGRQHHRPDGQGPRLRVWFPAHPEA